MGTKLDLLNRGEFVGNVLKVVEQLSDIKRGCCFAIEGGWGIGKTFVIEEIEERLKETVCEETGLDRYFVFHYNCWKHDYYEEPAVAIISAMIASIQTEESIFSEEAEDTIKAELKFAGEKLSEIAGLYLESKIGVNLIEWVKQVGEIKQDNAKARVEFDKMFNFSQTIEKVREKLQDIAKERTLVLVVDELDRCIPQYAIKVLERLHHIFYGLENVVVIMAIDRKQLEHSVEEMFGVRKDESSIDVEKYLKKFIDFSMVLDNGTMNECCMDKYKFYLEKFSITEEDDVEKVNKILQVIMLGIDIRRVEKSMEKANIVHSVICDKQVDVSVFAFEVMYELLKENGFDYFDKVVHIGDNGNKNLMAKLGLKRFELLVQIEKGAWHGYTRYLGIDGQGQKKNICYNLYGKVIWYFANIFNEQNIPYTENNGKNDELANCLEIARKYVEYCKLIK